VGRRTPNPLNLRFAKSTGNGTPVEVCNTGEMSHTPKRIVSLQPSATVILRDLGRLDALAGCTKYCVEVCPEIVERNIAIVADSWTAQAQQISEIKPDLVVASVPYQEKAVAEIMKSGARFLGLAPKSLADIYGDIAVIAGVVDARDEGRVVIAGMEGAIENVLTKASALLRSRVFCEEWGKPLIASQGWVAELVQAAGGDFVGTPGAQVTFAAVEAASPDILIAAWCGAGDRVPLDKIIRQRGWDNLPAVRNGRVCCIRDEYLNTPAPTLIQGLHALAAAIHPEYFPQVSGLRWIAND
jgi:iron complex transport system substrate-binding protein